MVAEAPRSPAARLAPRSTVDIALERARRRAGDGDRIECCKLWSDSWDHAALVRLRGELGSHRLLVVEPVAGVGWRRVVQGLLTPWWRRQLGHHFNRDLPIQLRAAGFTIDQIDRFTAGPLGLHSYAYVELSAHPPA